MDKYIKLITWNGLNIKRYAEFLVNNWKNIVALYILIVGLVFINCEMVWFSSGIAQSTDTIKAVMLPILTIRVKLYAVIAFIVFAGIAISYLISLIIPILTEFIFQQYYSDTYYFLSNRLKYRAKLYNITEKYLYLFIAVLSSVIILTLSLNNSFHSNTKSMWRDINIAFIFVSFFAPLFYLLAVIFIRHKRIKSNKKILFFDKFFFSKESTRRRFKTVIDLLIILFLIGRVFMPLAHHFTEKTINNGYNQLLNKYDYENRFNELINDVQYTNGKITIDSEFLDSIKVENVKKYLVAINPNVIGMSRLNNLLPSIMRGFILALSIFALIEIGFYSLVGSFVYDRGNTFKSIIKATIGSTIFFTFLQLMLGEAFFVETDKLLNVSTILIFFITYFMYLQSTPEVVK
ncbi:MAG: hypothetical protein R6W72_01310 [Desulfurivibrionaceae bacterium]